MPGYIASTSVNVGFDVDLQQLRDKLDDASRQKIDLTANLKLNDAQVRADLARMSRDSTGLTAKIRLDSTALKADLAALSRSGNMTLTARVKIDKGAAMVELRAIKAELQAEASKGDIKMALGIDKDAAVEDFKKLADKLHSEAAKIREYITPEVDGRRAEGENKSLGERLRADVSRFKLLFRSHFDKQTGDKVVQDAKQTGEDAGKAADAGMATGFSTKGQLILAAVAALLPIALGTLPAIAGIAGAAAGVSLGLYFADKSSKTIQREMKGLKATVKGSMSEIGKEAGASFAGPLAQSISLIDRALPGLSKGLGGLFAASAPALTSFTRLMINLVSGILPGFTKMVRATVGPLSQFASSAGRIVGSNLGKFFADLAPGMGPSVKLFGRLLDDITGLLPPIAHLASAFAKDLGPAIGGTFGAITHVLGGVINFTAKSRLMVDAIGSIAVVLGLVKAGMLGYAAVISLVRGATAAWAVTQTALDLALAPTTIIIALVVVALVALGVAIYEIVTHTHQLSKAFDDMRHSVAAAVDGMVHFVVGSFVDMWRQVSGTSSAVFHDVTGFFNNMYHGVISSVQAMWHGTASAFDAGRHDIASTASGAFHDVTGFFNDLYHGVASSVAALWHNAESVFDSGRHAVTSSVSSLWHAVESVFSSSIHAVESAAQGFWHGLETGFAATVHAVSGAWDKISSAVDAPVKFIIDTVYDKGIVRFWNDVAGAVGLPKLPALHFQDGGIVPGAGAAEAMATGGTVRGGIHGQDSVPAMLAPGELVIPSSHAASFGAQAKQAGIPGFAGGGIPNPISAVQHAASSVVHGAKSLLGDAGAIIKSLASKGASALLSSAVGPMVNAIPSGKSEISQLPKDMVKKLVTSIASTITSSASSSSSGGPNGGPMGGATGSSLANGRQLYNYLLHNVFGGSKVAAAGATASIWGECVTLDNMILTKRGWLKHDEVTAGDETIGYNSVTGKSEWTRVTRVVHYSDREVVRYGNQYWSATFTPNHRWLTEAVGDAPATVTGTDCPACGRKSPTSRGLRVHMAKLHGVRGDHAHSRGSSETVGEPAFKKFCEFTPNDRIILSRPASTGAGLPITDREAALLGWIAGDGSVSDGQNTARGLQVFVYQSKEKNFAAIEDCLAGVESVSRYVRDRRGYSNGVGGITRLIAHEWRLPAAYARDLINRAGNPKTEAEAQVRAMSSSQRRAWLDAMYLAEGTPRTGGRTFYQNKGTVADAIELALYLEGYRPGVSEIRPGHVAITDSAPTVGGYKRRSFTEPAGYADVWCVTTKLGSWTARNDSGVFLTGNSSWNPFAVGTGGRGLIGWTPEGTISNSAFAGGMATQLPQIIRFISSSGDWGVINRMKSATSVFEAANLWGRGVERFGINDVHSTGVSLATSFMKNGGVAGGKKPYSAGGMITEPVAGVGLSSGLPYSFAEHGSEQVIPGGSAAQGSNRGMKQPVTSSQGQTMIAQNATIIRLLQQQGGPTTPAGGNGTLRKGISNGWFRPGS